MVVMDMSLQNTIFCRTQSKNTRHKEAIIATIHIGLSNARIESMNNKIKVVIRKAYEFRNCIDMIMIVCSNLYKEIRLPYEILKSNKVYSTAFCQQFKNLFVHINQIS